VDDSIGRGCSAAQAFQVLQIASMRLGAGGFKRLCARIRPRHSKNVVTRADEFFHDGETDESGSASNKYTHMCLPDLVRAKIDERLPPRLKRTQPPNKLIIGDSLRLQEFYR
jgi:hypothetical protein